MITIFTYQQTYKKKERIYSLLFVNDRGIKIFSKMNELNGNWLEATEYFLKDIIIIINLHFKDDGPFIVYGDDLERATKTLELKYPFIYKEIINPNNEWYEQCKKIVLDKIEKDSKFKIVK